MPFPGLPANADIINNLMSATEFFAARGMQMPPNWMGMSPEEKQNMLDQVIQQSQTATKAIKTVEENANMQKEQLNDLQLNGISPVAKKTMFNLKKAQFAPPMGQPAAMPQAPAPQMPPGNPMNPQVAESDPEAAGADEMFADAGALKEKLANMSPDQAIHWLSDKYTNANQIVSDPNNPNSQDEALNVIKDAVNAFYSTDDPQLQLEAASSLYRTILPDGATGTPDSSDVPAQYETQMLASVVENTNQTLKKLAQSQAEKPVKKAKGFNLSKQAQHKSIEHVVTFGPNQTTIDAFTGQQISNWHLVERNKGFGLKIDDILDIDFEAIWRGNIMDKYSRPYRDKEGNWIGGYVQSRFEVDKNIPELNNYQLKPGERRKPRPPEYGIIGARLEAARSEMKKDRGYAPSEKGEPFNWVKANADKKKVEAQLEPPKFDGGLKPMRMPGEPAPKDMSKVPVCPYCGGDISKGKMGTKVPPGYCPNCHARIGNPLERDPTNPGTGLGPLAVPKNVPLPRAASSSVDKTASDGIFFDGHKFIVYAQGQRNMFEGFDAAKNFQTDQMNMPQDLPPGITPEVWEQMTPEQRERYQIADKLGIDG